MALRRERVEFNGETLELPLPDGPGKALKLTIAPVQERIPIYIAAIGPKNTTLTAEIADGWIPTLFSPEHVAEFRPLLEEGFARAGGGKGFADFDIAPTGQRLRQRRPRRRPRRDAPLPRALRRRDGLAQAELLQRARAALRVRGRRRSASRTSTSTASKDEAAAALPGELIDAVSLCGPPDVVRERLALFRDAGVGTLIVSPMAWSFEERLRAAPARGRAGRVTLPPDLERAPARPGDEARDRRARRRVRRELPRVDAARLGAAAARPRARPLARADHRRLLVDADRRWSRAAVMVGARLLHAGGRPAHAPPARAARPGQRRPRRCSPSSRSRGRAHVSAVFTHPDRWREGDRARAARGSPRTRCAPRATAGAAVDAARGARPPLLRGRGLAARRPPAVAGRARAADRRVRQAAVRSLPRRVRRPGACVPDARARRGARRPRPHGRAADVAPLGGARGRGRDDASPPRPSTRCSRRASGRSSRTRRRCARRARPCRPCGTFAPGRRRRRHPHRRRPRSPPSCAACPVATLVPHVFPWAAPGFPPYSLGARLPRTRARRARLARASTRSWRAGSSSGRDEYNDCRARLGLAAARPASTPALSRELTLVATLPQLEYPRDWPPWTAGHRPAAVGAAGRARRRRRPATGRSCWSRRRPRRTPEHALLRAALAGLARAPVRVIATYNGREPDPPVRRARRTPCSCPGCPTRARCPPATSS